MSRASLIGADLSDANLTRADLAYADLTDANLAYADLSDANRSLVGKITAGGWGLDGKGTLRLICVGAPSNLRALDLPAKPTSEQAYLA